MENRIEQVAEPRKLILAWQPSDLTADRFRWAVGLLEPQDEVCALRYIRPGPEFAALNGGREYEGAVELGYRGYPAFNPKREVHNEGVLAAFMRRLPPRGRSDFAEYMRQFRLRADVPLSDIALLGRTEAKLPSDGFSLVDPLDPGTEQCDLMLEIAGYRHYAKAGRHLVDVGRNVDVLAEPESIHDTQAVKVCLGGRKLGNINRLQAPTFRQWLQVRRITAQIERLNGDPRRLRAFIFIRVRPA